VTPVSDACHWSAPCRVDLGEFSSLGSKGGKVRTGYCGATESLPYTQIANSSTGSDFPALRLAVSSQTLLAKLRAKLSEESTPLRVWAGERCLHSTRSSPRVREERQGGGDKKFTKVRVKVRASDKATNEALVRSVSVQSLGSPLCLHVLVLIPR